MRPLNLSLLDLPWLKLPWLSLSWLSLPLLVMFALVVGGCGVGRVAPTPASLRVIAQPETAQIEIDERFVGSARLLAVRPKQLRPGTHRVTVRAPGFFPHDLEVDLPSGETTVRISLREIPQ